MTHKIALALIALFAALPVAFTADAHQSGCHRWHSCPSDSGSYTCGDTGYCSYWPDNQYCKDRAPRGSGDDEAKTRKQAPTPTPKPIAPTPAPTPAAAPKYKGENGWTEKHCPGQTQVTLPDGTRPDCVYINAEGSSFVVEVDFPKKWAECLGQTLHYGRMMPKAKGECWLVCGKDGDKCARYAERVEKARKHAYGLIGRKWNAKGFVRCFSWHTGRELDCSSN